MSRHRNGFADEPNWRRCKGIAVGEVRVGVAGGRPGPGTRGGGRGRCRNRRGTPASPYLAPGRGVTWPAQWHGFEVLVAREMAQMPRMPSKPHIERRIRPWTEPLTERSAPSSCPSPSASVAPEPGPTPTVRGRRTPPCLEPEVEGSRSVVPFRNGRGAHRNGTIGTALAGETGFLCQWKCNDGCPGACNATSGSAFAELFGVIDENDRVVVEPGEVRRAASADRNSEGAELGDAGTLKE